MNTLPPLNRRASIVLQAHTVLVLVLVLAMAIATSSCSTMSNVANMVGIGSKTNNNVPPLEPLQGYRIGPADVLSISVWHQDAMSRTVTVRPDGNISLPLLHEVSVIGLTPAQLEQQLTTSLKEYMNILPGELTVMVDEVHSYSVSVLGEVRTPGHFEFKRDFTVLDALAQAGGLTEFASPRKILILHPQANGTRRTEFDYKKVLAASAAQPEIYPGDTILVP